LKRIVPTDEVVRLNISRLSKGNKDDSIVSPTFSIINGKPTRIHCSHTRNNVESSDEITRKLLSASFVRILHKKKTKPKINHSEHLFTIELLAVVDQLITAIWYNVSPEPHSH